MAKKETNKKPAKKAVKVEEKKKVTKKTIKTEPKKETKKVANDIIKDGLKKVAEEKKVEKKKEVKENKEKKDHGILFAVIGIVLVVALGVLVNLIKDKGPAEVELRSGKVYAVLAIEGYDEMLLELDADVAPITVTNFINLANDGFYDGLTFHRMVKGFMMQGGDPTGTGNGGNGTTIEGEFEANGHENSIKHVKGTISMARGDDPNSASTQFFIVTDNNATTEALDGNYAAFGGVVSGEETLDKLMEDFATKEDTILAEGKRPVITSIREISLEDLMG